MLIFLLVAPGIYFWSQPIDGQSCNKRNLKTMMSFAYTKWGNIGWIGPSLSIVACVVTSLLFHYDDTTKTHCDVTNPLPSISAAVGNNLPERWFFRYGILFMSGQRLLDGTIQYNWFQRLLPVSFGLQWLNGMMLIFHWVENVALFTIAFVSSTEYYPIHEKAFITWTLFQQMKMISYMILLNKITKHPFGGVAEKRSFQWRFFLWATNAFLLFIAGIVFVVHSQRCVPYLYAFYAFLEYSIVGTNVMYNCCVLLDWPQEMFLVISSHNDLSEVEEKILV